MSPFFPDIILTSGAEGGQAGGKRKLKYKKNLMY